MTVIQPYDLVGLADALEAYSNPHVGSAWGKAIAEDYGLPMPTPRQEEIIGSMPSDVPNQSEDTK